MRLYEITGELAEIVENLEAILAWEPDTNADGLPTDSDGNIIADVPAYREELLAAWQETLEAVGGEFDEKAGNIAVYIKSLKLDCEMLKREEKALESRRRAKENALKRMTEYLIDAMEQAGKKRVDVPRARFYVKENAESAAVKDEDALILWAQENGMDEILRYPKPELRKTVIKALLQGGGKLPGAYLTRTKSVIIK